MKRNRLMVSWIILIVFFATFLFCPGPVYAHCDGMDGPVVTAAKKALESGDVNLVLIWVQKDDEPIIRKAFDKALAVRKLGPEAGDLADLYFFETLVRIHRAGEGAPYTGLKPADRNLGPAIPAADKALEDGSVEPLVKLISDEAQAGIRKHYKEAVEKKNFKKDDLKAGRDYVKAYVIFIHYVEGIHQAISSTSHAHAPEPMETRGDQAHHP